MRVLILATDLHTRGGIARYTATLAATLGEVLGAANTDVLCFHNWGPTPTRPQPYRLLGMMGSRATAATRLRFIAAALDAAGRDDPYTLVIANHVALAPVAWLLRLRHGMPYWVACHSIEVWWKIPWWERWALRRADRVLPVSAFTRDVLQQRHGLAENQLRLVPNVISADWAAQLGAPPGAPAGDPVLLSVCNLARSMAYKGVDTVLQALPRLAAEFPRLRYVVAGFGDGQGELEAMARRLGVADRVEFRGEVNDAELAELYRGCDIFVLPSRGQSEGGAFGGEGFGRVYVEAALAGKPSIAGRAGGAIEAVRDGVTGLLIDPTSIDELTAAALRLLRDPHQAAAMGEAGRHWARETFTATALLQALSMPPLASALKR